MARLVSSADIVLSPAAVETAVSLAEDGETSTIMGRAVEDASGRYYEMTGTGDPIGMSFPSEGGTHPDEDMLESFRGGFREGILMVIDRYAGEFALYIVTADGFRAASALMSE